MFTVNDSVKITNGDFKDKIVKIESITEKSGYKGLILKTYHSSVDGTKFKFTDMDFVAVDEPIFLEKESIKKDKKKVETTP